MGAIVGVIVGSLVPFNVGASVGVSVGATVGARVGSLLVVFGGIEGSGSSIMSVPYTVVIAHASASSMLVGRVSEYPNMILSVDSNNSHEYRSDHTCIVSAVDIKSLEY